MKNIKTGYIIKSSVCFFFLFALVSCANAFPGPHDDFPGEPPFHGEGGPEKVMQEIMDELKLTTEQKVQIETFHKEEFKNAKMFFDTMRKKNDEMRIELETYDHDQAKINALIEELTALHKQMTQQRVNGIVAIKKILTKEQFEELQKKIHFKMEVHKEARRMLRKRDHENIDDDSMDIPQDMPR